MAFIVHRHNKSLKEIIGYTVRTAYLNKIVAELLNLEHEPLVSDKPMAKYVIYLSHINVTRSSFKYFIPFIAEYCNCAYLGAKKPMFCIIYGPQDLLAKAIYMVKKLDINLQTITTKQWTDFNLAYQRYFYDNFNVLVSQYDLYAYGIMVDRSIHITLFVKEAAIQLANEYLDKEGESLECFMRTLAYFKSIYRFEYAPFSWSRLIDKIPEYPIHSEELARLGSLMYEQAQRNGNGIKNINDDRYKPLL